jgi:1-deoxy-D-xylulose-5-phosphate synthase
MLYTMVKKNGGPMAIRYPRDRGEGVVMDDELKELPWGKGELRREGEDLVIIAVGNMVHPSIKAAGLLADKGVSATVINARFVKPLDRDLILTWAADTGVVVTVEENVIAGGFGSAVIETLQEAGLDHVASQRIGIPDAFVEHGDPAQLRADYGLTSEGIADSCLKLLKSREKNSRD